MNELNEWKLTTLGRFFPLIFNGKCTQTTHICTSLSYLWLWEHKDSPYISLKLTLPFQKSHWMGFQYLFSLIRLPFQYKDFRIGNETFKYITQFHRTNTTLCMYNGVHSSLRNMQTKKCNSYHCFLLKIPYKWKSDSPFLSVTTTPCNDFIFTNTLFFSTLQPYCVVFSF